MSSLPSPLKSPIRGNSVPKQKVLFHFQPVPENPLPFDRVT
ncbi:MAG: hypothetical protein U0736_27065 [Gemmataceae bacterium]